MRVRIFHGVRRCVAQGLCRSRFHSIRRKVRHHVTWCLAKTIATRHQGEMWPLQMVTAAGRCSLSHRQKHKLASREDLRAKHFVHRIDRVWTRFTCHLGCSLADGLPSSKFLLSWQKEESDWQKHGRNYRMVQSLPIHHFYHLFTVNVIRQMAPLFSKVDSNKLRRDVQNEELVIFAKFCKDLLNISKLWAVKQSGPVFWPTRYVFTIVFYLS